LSSACRRPPTFAGGERNDCGHPFAHSGYAWAARVDLDCQHCGACCHNSAENLREGSRDWIEVDSDETLVRRRRAAALLVRGADDRLHMKLVDGGRCIALRGSIGARVTCSIYDVRPRPCRRVQPGDPDCMRARAERGVA
jgi:hypothetical protein